MRLGFFYSIHQLSGHRGIECKGQGSNLEKREINVVGRKKRSINDIESLI